MNESSPIEIFDTAADLARAAADAAAQLLAGAVKLRGAASLAVCGGSTPGPIFDRLCQADLPWGKVAVTLTDERWVDPSDADSNERLVRERLLRGPAGTARFVPLKTPAATVGEGAAAAAAAVTALPPPLDLILLGMGPDGHIASLFPGEAVLRQAPGDDGPACLGVAPRDPAPPQARLSLSPRILSQARQTLLAITGHAKLDTLKAALGGHDRVQYPVRLVLQSGQPLRVLWAP